MGCGPSTPSGEEGSAYHEEVTVYEAGGGTSAAGGRSASGSADGGGGKKTATYSEMGRFKMIQLCKERGLDYSLIAEDVEALRNFLRVDDDGTSTAEEFGGFEEHGDDDSGAGSPRRIVNDWGDDVEHSVLLADDEEVAVYEAGGNNSDDAGRVATAMKGPPHVSKEVAVVIVRIMNKEPAFAAEVEAAKTAAGGATPAVLKVAAEQAAAAVGTIYSMVVSLRKQWAESGGEEGRLPEEGETEFRSNSVSQAIVEVKQKAILHRLHTAEASLRNILSVVIDEWKLDVGGKAAGAGAAETTSTDAFKRLPIADAGPGVPTMLSEIGALVVAHHRNEPYAAWYCWSTPPDFLSDVVNHFYEARNMLVTMLVPAILTDVELYDAEAKIQASAAGPEVLARLAAVAKNPNATPLTPERIAHLTSIRTGSSSSSVPGSRTLARLSHDQMVACSGSIILYKRTSAAVKRAESMLSAPGVVLPGDVKGKERTIYKSAIKYNGDTTRCHDKIRCTVELQTLRDVAVVAEALVELPEFLIVKVKNRFDPAYDALPIGGYRDLQISGLIKLDNDDAAAASGSDGAAYAWCEVQLNLTRMIALKSGKAEGQASSAEKAGGKGGKGKSGHDAFNMARAINAFAPELFVHQGEWSSDVGKQVAAGLLLEVNLGDTNMAGEVEAAEFAKAFGSKQCRVGKLEMGGMKLGEVARAAIAEALKVNTTLTSIDLDGNNLGGVAGAAIGEALKVNTTLTSITLWGNDLGEVAGAAIGEALTVNTTLTSITLSQNNLGEVAWAAIAEALKVNTTLTSIDLRGNALKRNNLYSEVTWAAVAEALKVNTTLTSIILTANYFGEVAGAAIGEALKGNTMLTFINLSGNNLGGVGGAAIGEALKMNTTLTSIDLCGNGTNNLGEVGGAAIGEALKANITLTSITLRDNNLGEVAGAAIGEALKVNTTLTSIALSENNLGAFAGAAIAEALKVNTTLTSITLWGNELGEVGGAAIAEALKVNTTLTNIKLGDNNLGEVAGAAIGQALQVNTTLTNITLDDNNLGEVGGAAIAKALKGNTTLTDIDSDYTIPSACREAIEAAVRSNKAAAKYGIDAFLLKKDAGIATLIKSNRRQVTELDLTYLQLDEVGGAAIGEALQVNTTLTSIWLGDNNLGEVAGAAITEALKVNTTLTSITLDYTIPAACTNPLEAAVARNKAAAKYGIDALLLKKDAGIATLIKSNRRQVTELDLTYLQLDEVAGAAIAEALKVNTTLTSINLNSNNLGEVAGTAIAEAFKVNTTLTSIDLQYGNALTAASIKTINAAVARNKDAAYYGIDALLLEKDAGAAIATLIKSNRRKMIYLGLGSLATKYDIDWLQIAGALKANTTLTSIDLHENNLGEVGGAAIAEALTVNTTLTSIWLGDNNLGEVGGAAIAEALKVNTTLTSIALSENNLGEVAGAAIGEALKVNTTLTNITLGDNNLGEVAGAAIGEALKVNTTLTNITLGDNNLGEVAGAAIGQALQVNTTLTFISLYRNKFSDATEEAIEAAVRRNEVAAQ